MTRRALSKPALLLAAAALLAGCAEGPPVANVVKVSGAEFRNVRGEADLTVRTFIAGEGVRQEVSGARCSLETSLYSTAFTTPARLLLPNFGPQSPELRLDCAAGEWSGSADVGIRTWWREPPGAYAGYGYGYRYGPYGPWGTWGWPGYGPGYRGVPESDYPDVRIELR